MNYSLKRLSRCALVLLATVVLSCDDDTADANREDKTSDYYPLTKGRYITYDVNEIKYALGIPETLAYELKVAVVDSFAYKNDSYVYVIYRYKRLPGETVWNYLDTWSATAGVREAIVNESNVQYLKFKTPFTSGLEWDGNTYNDQGEDDYVMQEVKESHSYGGLNFEDCITIEQSNNDDYIVFLDQRTETYSRDIGMVYKETTQLHYCTQTEQGCLGEQFVEDGLIYKQTIKAYGHE